MKAREAEWVAPEALFLPLGGVMYENSAADSKNPICVRLSPFD